MQNILAKRNLARLSEFATSNVLLGFDYDGTLAPIAGIPADARMGPTTLRLLMRVARCYPCIVISGRSYEDIAKRLRRVSLVHVLGNHGSEPWVRSDAAAAVVRQWVRKLRARLGASAGIVVEDKKYSVAIHYRHARDRTRARQDILSAVEGLNHVRLLGGDHAFNLIWREGPDKGVTLQRARRVLACDRALYVGDDDTDEDAFMSPPRSQLLAIRVGSARRSSSAGYFLKTQAAIDDLLETLLLLRRSCSTPRGTPGEPASGAPVARGAP